MAPTGVVSVSPVTRQATKAKTNEGRGRHRPTNRACRRWFLPGKRPRPWRPLVRPETRHWRFQSLDRVIALRAFLAKHAPELLKSAEGGSPLKKEAQQSCGHHASRTPPKRPLDDPAEPCAPRHLGKSFFHEGRFARMRSVHFARPYSPWPYQVRFPADKPSRFINDGTGQQAVQLGIQVFARCWGVRPVLPTSAARYPAAGPNICGCR